VGSGSGGVGEGEIDIGVVFPACIFFFGLAPIRRFPSVCRSTGGEGSLGDGLIEFPAAGRYHPADVEEWDEKCPLAVCEYARDAFSKCGCKT